jgi:hypothetical protein
MTKSPGFVVWIPENEIILFQKTLQERPELWHKIIDKKAPFFL